MRFITGIIFCVLMTAACSTPAVLSEESLVIEPKKSFPEWYNADRASSSDSIHFNGYSMATAMNSEEAISLGINSAISNLRYEIDKFTEERRETLVGEQHNTSQFIIKLRNSVQQLQLTDATIEREFAMRDDDVTQVYTRVSVNRSEIIERISELLSDEEFIRALYTD